MVINPRSMAGLVAIWVLAIGGVSATAWFAIDRAGRDLTSASMSSLTPPTTTTPAQGEPTQTEPAPTPTSTPTPSVASPPSPSTPAPGPRGSATPSDEPSPSAPTKTPTAQVRSVTVPGGQVTVRCVGPRIRLQVAQPENDWHVRVETRSGRIGVTFRSGDEEEESRRTEVTATCIRGIPVFDISD